MIYNSLVKSLFSHISIQLSLASGVWPGRLTFHISQVALRFRPCRTLRQDPNIVMWSKSNLVTSMLRPQVLLSSQQQARFGTGTVTWSYLVFFMYSLVSDCRYTYWPLRTAIAIALQMLFQVLTLNCSSSANCTSKLLDTKILNSCRRDHNMQKIVSTTQDTIMYVPLHKRYLRCILCIEFSCRVATVLLA